MPNKVLTIIPVRLASTRLPNKPLADIAGKSMIQRVYEQAIKANIGDVIIACDGQEIAEEAKRIGAKFVITDPNLPSGTDRIYEAYKQISQDKDYIKNIEIILNLQGDLPNIDPKIIASTADIALKQNCDITTIASKIIEKSEINNPNVVKIAIAFKEENVGKALYFSRSAIPYGKENEEFYHHIGIYAYKKESLEKFVNLKQSALEKRESLEQLRALENDMNIYVNIVATNPLSVDTREDLENVTKNIIANEKT